MATAPQDTSVKVDLSRLELRMRHGRQEAFCRACGGWMVFNQKTYLGQRDAMWQLPHNYPCTNMEAHAKPK